MSTSTAIKLKDRIFMDGVDGVLNGTVKWLQPRDDQNDAGLVRLIGVEFDSLVDRKNMSSGCFQGKQLFQASPGHAALVSETLLTREEDYFNSGLYDYGVADDSGEKGNPAQKNHEERLNCMKVRRKDHMANHDKKIEDARCKLEDLKKRCKKVSLDEVQIKIDEIQVLNEKLHELTLQKHEFEERCQKLSVEINEIKEDGKDSSHELFKNFDRECLSLEQGLPIYAWRRKICETVKRNQVCIILGETGSGKSTQISKYLFENGYGKEGVIACTQPRKVAAISLANRVALELATIVGSVVGYWVGMQKELSSVTKILYLTDHILLKECIADPMLSKYSCIVIDEAHERSIYTDLLIGMVKSILPKRPEMRVIVTSATMNTDLFSNYFDQCPVLKVSGRTYPIEVIWSNDNGSTLEQGSGGDYIHKAVDTALEVHKNEEEGDILVFLTSPTETERAVQLIEARTGRSQQLLCMQLHGKLQSAEQLKVFEPAPYGKRKIVFATNCAETSITIKGIKFVVDTGMVKEKKFDSARNMDSLVITKISKSSAEQRKGRAGRMEPGKCFRLYTEDEYLSMENSSAPELLRMHIGQAMLQLLVLLVDVSNLRQFSFIQAPPTDAMTCAIQELTEIQAISKQGYITDLGRKLASMPLEPRLGKLVIDSIADKIGMEGMVLASISTVTGSIFFRMGSEEEKMKADISKLPFCQPEGDMISLLCVYQQWLPIHEKKKNAWCVENSINAKAMRMTRDTVKELKQIVEKDFKIKIKMTFKPLQESKNILLPIILNCFASNISIYSGHPQIGYFDVNRGLRVRLHPSSALAYLAEIPKWVVFQNVLKTNYDYMVNVTQVSPELVCKRALEGHLSIDVERAKKLFVCTSVLVSDFGKRLLSKITGKRFSICKSLQQKISSTCNDSAVAIDVNFERCEVNIVTENGFSNVAQNILNDHLQPFREEFRQEHRIELVQGSCVRMVIGAGGGVNDILMPDEYINVIVKDVPVNITDDEVLHTLDDYGRILCTKRFAASSRVGSAWGTVTFSSKFEACHAVRDRSDATYYKLKPDVRRYTQIDRSKNFQVVLQYVRRPCTGIGFIKFANETDFYTASLFVSSLFIRHNLVSVRRNKKQQNELYMKGLPDNVSNEEIKKAINWSLMGHSISSDPEIVIIRIKRYETDSNELEGFKKLIKDQLDLIFGSDFSLQEYELHIKKPNDTNILQDANVYFANPSIGDTFMLKCGHCLLFNSKMVTIKPRLSARLFLFRGIYETLSKQIETAVDELQHTTPRLIITKTKKNGNLQIEIVHDDRIAFAKCLTTIQEFTEGDKVQFANNDYFKFFTKQDGREILKEIQNETFTFIQTDTRTNMLNIYGTQAAQSSAKILINQYLDKVVGTDTFEDLPFAGKSFPSGMLRLIIKKYGKTLDDLKTECGVQTIAIDLRKKCLKVCGSNDALNKVKDVLLEIAGTLDNSESATDVIECSVCFTEVPDGQLYRLELCGHPYCDDCMNHQINSAKNNKEFPLLCAAENCTEQTWCLKDVMNFLKPGSNAEFFDAALNSYVSQNSDKVSPCLTPNCKMVYCISTDGKRFSCPLCHTDICTSCNVQYHGGITCTMYQSAKGDDKDLEKWLSEDTKNRKACPKCFIKIEKNDGCNHMTCIKCKCDFCWICMKIEHDGNEVYRHIRRDHLNTE